MECSREMKLKVNDMVKTIDAQSSLQGAIFKLNKHPYP